MLWRKVRGSLGSGALRCHQEGLFPVAFEKSNKGAGPADTWGRESPQRAGKGRGRAEAAGGRGSSSEAGVAGLGRGAASHARGLQSRPRARLAFEKPLSYPEVGTIGGF